VHVSAVVSPANGIGTRTDSVGNSGTCTFCGNVAGLPSRPFPVSGLGASTITTVEIAAGAVGASDINTAEVQARVTGTCPAGQAVTGILANGAVACASTDVAVQFKVRGHPTLTVPASTITPVIWSASAAFNVGGGTEWKCLFAMVNSATSNEGLVCEATATGFGVQLQQMTNVLSLTAGDVLRIGMFQTSGASVGPGPGVTNDAFFSAVVTGRKIGTGRTGESDAPALRRLPRGARLRKMIAAAL